MLIKSLFFYAVITLEAFIFCYAGEYLSAKVRLMQSRIDVLFLYTNKYEILSN